MISCTEFIPSYSTLFTFLEKNYGVEEVHRYWEALFDPEQNGPTHLLDEEVRRHGIAGCWNYWTHTLNEEAADFVLYLNEDEGWYLCRMRHCPSKGRLLETTQITPYWDYCSHCDMYRRTIEKYGLRYLYDFTDCASAACSLLICDPNRFSGTLKITPETRIMKRTAGDNRYFHRDFHLSMNAGVEYLGQHFGAAAVERYLREYTNTFFAPLAAQMQKTGLGALSDYLHEIYRAEEAEDVLRTVLDGDVLTVRICACPAVTHIRKQGRTVSQWYGMTTGVVMEELARMTQYRFQLLAYDDATGRTEYVFKK